MIDASSLPLPADRAGRVRWLLEREEATAALVRQALVGIVTAALDRFVASIAPSTLTASGEGDLGAFDPIPDQWVTVVREELVDQFGETYAAGQVTAWLGLPYEPSEQMAKAWQATVNENAQSYLDNATNRLAHTGESTWRLVRGQVSNSMREGFTIDSLRDKVQQVTAFAASRAEVIARTETVGAYVQGDMAGNRALGANGPIEKVWRATMDQRTRESHAMTEGQVRKLDEPFDVGGTPMDSPHDPSAPPGEVVQCRCYVEFLYPTDARPDGTVVEPDPVAAVAPELTAPPDPTPPAEPVGPTISAAAERRAAAADKWGVSEAQVQSHLEDVRVVKARIKREAERAMADSIGYLDSFEGLKLRRPPVGRALGGEYDFLEQIGRSERNRLSGWWTEGRSAAIDVTLERAQSLGIVSDSMQVDEFTDLWMHHNRVIDTAKSLRAGRWPAEARFGGLNPADLVPELAGEGIDIGRVIRAVDAEDAAGYLAQQTAEASADDAWRLLRPDDVTLGPAPWRMSYQSWEAEVRDLEFSIDGGSATAREVARHAELVPRLLDTGQEFEQLYAEVVEVARMAKLDVSSWAVIPWA